MSRSNDLLKVLQGLSAVLNQFVKAEAPVAADRLTQLGKHGKDLANNLSHAAYKSACRGSTTSASNAYPPPAPYAPVSRLPKLTPEQVLQQQHHAVDVHAPAGAATRSDNVQQTQQPYPVHTVTPSQQGTAKHDRTFRNTDAPKPTQQQQQKTADTIAATPIAKPNGATVKQPSKSIDYSVNHAAAVASETRGTTPANTALQQQHVPKHTVDEQLHADAAASGDAAETTAMQGNPAATAVESPARRGRTRAVPSTPLARVLGFGQLAAGLAMGTVAEALRQRVGGSSSSNKGANSDDTHTPDGAPKQRSSYVVTDANAERLAEGLCRMRGAALKLGQMLSIQDESLIPPQLSKALERVRSGADVMPSKQLFAQLDKAFGRDWRDKLSSFEDHPIAAASIGQVHKAVLKDGTQVAMKIQYPGVANSIESDLSNLERLVTITNILPPGLFVEEVVEVAREELKLECNYELEAAHQERFARLIAQDTDLKQHLNVPHVCRELVTQQVLTTHFVAGVPIDKVATMSQATRNHVARLLLKLTVKELFEWRFMQTDPNWGNYMYNADTRTLHLIDFGACRDYDQHFIDSYMELVWSAANSDTDTLARVSTELKFLTGQESSEMLAAHTAAGLVVGEPFRSNEPFDFHGSNLTTRISKHGEVFARQRKTPPPREAYSLHRKLAGAFLACIKLRAKIPCRDILEDTYKRYHSKQTYAHTSAAAAATTQPQ